MSEKMILTCKYCKGSGKKPPDAVIGVLTFGLMYLFEKAMPRECPVCDGSGMKRYEIR